MKESFGALSITTIFVTLIILFSGYLCISVNQTKAYNVKNELVNIIQRHNGVDGSTIEEIAGHLNEVSYRSLGSCDEEDGIGYTLSGGRSQTKANYCIKCVNINVNLNDPYKQFPNASYYKVKVFFSLDLPIINNVFNFSLSGTTKTLYYPVNGGSCSV